MRKALRLIPLLWFISVSLIGLYQLLLAVLSQLVSSLGSGILTEQVPGKRSALPPATRELGERAAPRRHYHVPA